MQTQVAPIRARLVSPIGHVVLACGIFVSPLAAEALKRLAPKGLVLERAILIAADIDPTERYDYQQLGASTAVSLSSESVERTADGRLTLLEPFVLRPILGSDRIDVAALSENPRVLLLSSALRDCLSEIQPGLRFEAVRFADESPPPPSDFVAEDPIPTRDQLLAALRKERPS